MYMTAYAITPTNNPYCFNISAYHIHKTWFNSPRINPALFLFPISHNVTNEIIAAYGFEHLCKDKDGYVYNLSADDKEIPVTSEHKENIVAISHEDYEAGKDFVKRKK